MRRRELLAGASGVLIAGCLDSSDDDPAGDNPPGQSPSEPADEGNPRRTAATVQEVERATRELPTWTEVAITGKVENTGDTQIGAINLTGEFVAEDGSLLNTGVQGVRALAPGEIWEPWIGLAEDPAAVGSVDLRVSDVIPLNRTYLPEQLEILEHDIRIPEAEGSVTRVVGEVRNTGSEIGYADVRPKIYAENGHVLATGIQSIQNFPAGQTWRFDAPTRLLNTDWRDRIDRYDIVTVS